MLQSKQNVLGQARYLGSHQTCGKVCVMVMLPNGKLLSLTILKTGLCTKGYIIRSMEKLKLPRHPITLLHLFSLSYADYIVSSNNKFFFSPISSGNVFSLLNKLSKSKATGLNSISGKLIRECTDLILIPLCNNSTSL